jgi:hypothetical protein
METGCVDNNHLVDAASSRANSRSNITASKRGAQARLPDEPARACFDR